MTQTRCNASNDNENENNNEFEIESGSINFKHTPKWASTFFNRRIILKIWTGIILTFGLFPCSFLFFFINFQTWWIK